MIKPFETVVFQLFMDMLRASGQALNDRQIEGLRRASLQFSQTFKAEAEMACLKYLAEFQENVRQAMNELEQKVNAIDPKFLPQPISEHGMGALPPPGREEDIGKTAAELSRELDNSEKKSDN